MRARCPIDFPDRGSFVFGTNSVFADVAVRSDPDIELRAVRAGQQSLSPVMIDRAARKISELRAWGNYAGLSILIRKADDGISVRYVKVVANQSDAKRRVEVVQKHGSQLGSPVTLGAH